MLKCIIIKVLEYNHNLYALLHISCDESLLLTLLYI